MCWWTTTPPIVLVDCVRCDCETSAQHETCSPYKVGDGQKCVWCNRVM